MRGANIESRATNSLYSQNIGWHEVVEASRMFGKPDWFRPKSTGFGLIPVRWQGWAYFAGWVGTIGLPFWLMIARHQSLEALLWLTLATGTLAHDAWRMWLFLRQPEKTRQVPATGNVCLSRRALD